MICKERDHLKGNNHALELHSKAQDHNPEKKNEFRISEKYNNVKHSGKNKYKTGKSAEKLKTSFLLFVVLEVFIYYTITPIIVPIKTF